VPELRLSARTSPCPKTCSRRMLPARRSCRWWPRSTTRWRCKGRQSRRLSWGAVDGVKREEHCAVHWRRLDDCHGKEKISPSLRLPHSSLCLLLSSFRVSRLILITSPAPHYSSSSSLTFRSLSLAWFVLLPVCLPSFSLPMSYFLVLARPLHCFILSYPHSFHY
jgi:hypothetical protein